MGEGGGGGWSGDIVLGRRALKGKIIDKYLARAMIIVSLVRRKHEPPNIYIYILFQVSSA